MNHAARDAGLNDKMVVVMMCPFCGSTGRADADGSAVVPRCFSRVREVAERYTLQIAIRRHAAPGEFHVHAVEVQWLISAHAGDRDDDDHANPDRCA
jgi:hypothetical protein